MRSSSPRVVILCIITRLTFLNSVQKPLEGGTALLLVSAGANLLNQSDRRYLNARKYFFSNRTASPGETVVVITTLTYIRHRPEQCCKSMRRFWVLLRLAGPAG